MIDARWVLKWKKVDDQSLIHARLVVRCFKDLQATELSTFAGATSRWGQRFVNIIAVHKGWKLFSADVSQAFLRGLTFDEAAKQEHEVRRTVQFTVPPGSLSILQQLPSFGNFNPLQGPQYAPLWFRAEGRPATLEQCAEGRVFEDRPQAYQHGP